MFQSLVVEQLNRLEVLSYTRYLSEILPQNLSVEQRVRYQRLKVRLDNRLVQLDTLKLKAVLQATYRPSRFFWLDYLLAYRVWPFTSPMEETSSILPTLEQLVKDLLDHEAQLHDLRKVWTMSLIVNLPWTWYLEEPPETRSNSQQLQTQIMDLTRLINDCKEVIIGFIPEYLKSIPVPVNGQVYAVSKVKGEKNPLLLVVRRKN